MGSSFPLIKITLIHLMINTSENLHAAQEYHAYVHPSFFHRQLWTQILVGASPTSVDTRTQTFHYPKVDTLLNRELLNHGPDVTPTINDPTPWKSTL